MEGEPFWMDVLDDAYPARAAQLRESREDGSMGWEGVGPTHELLANILLKLSDIAESLEEISAALRK